jgi:hypothetical protein
MSSTGDKKTARKKSSPLSSSSSLSIGKESSSEGAEAPCQIAGELDISTSSGARLGMLVISTSSGTRLGVPCQAGGKPDTSHNNKKKEKKKKTSIGARKIGNHNDNTQSLK